MQVRLVNTAAQIFPTSVRARGLNFAASGGAIGSIVVAQIWPVGVAHLGSRIYFFFMAVNLACAPVGSSTTPTSFSPCHASWLMNDTGRSSGFCIPRQRAGRSRTWTTCSASLSLDTLLPSRILRRWSGIAKADPGAAVTRRRRRVRTAPRKAPSFCDERLEGVSMVHFEPRSITSEIRVFPTKDICQESYQTRIIDCLA